MSPPELKFYCEINVDLAPPIEKGPVPGGYARLIPITGGSVEGPTISGEVLNLGADWQSVYDSHAELDTRYAIQTNDGALIDVRNFGYRHGPADVLARITAGETVDPAAYYMRTHPRFQTGDPRYSWLNRTIFVGTGERLANSVRIGIFELL